MNLFWNASAADPASALVRSLTSNVPAVKTAWVLGDDPSINLYITDGAGGYDSQSGAGSVVPWLAICTPGAVPTGGTFWLGVSSATSGTLTSGKRYQIQTFVAGDSFANVGASADATGVIFTASGTTPTTWSNGSTLIEITTDVAFSATAAVLEAALEATQAIVGVSVTKAGASPIWMVQQDSVGAWALMTGGGDLLTPDSAAVTASVRTGTSSVTARQIVRLARQPYALQTSWSGITSGWTARLSCSTQGLADLLDGAAKADAFLELQTVDADGHIRTIGQVPCIVRNEGIDPASLIPVPMPSYLTAAEARLAFLQNQYSLTTLTGGAAFCLDGIVTGTTATPMVQTGTVVVFEFAGNLEFYRLEAGVNTENSPDVILPDDYAGATNARYWQRLKPAAASASSFEAISFSSAGNSVVTPGVNSAVHCVEITVAAGGGAYTRTVDLLTANSSAGDVCSIHFAMPASANPLIEVRDATSGGTVLCTITGEAGGDDLAASFYFDGSAWQPLSANYLD